MSQRKAPNQSASDIKVGTIMTGQDDEQWIVRKLSNGTKRWVHYGAVIFVFYTMAMANKQWTYKNLPKGWAWTGAGSTSNINYPREEQFNGPRESRDSMREMLDDFFKDLKKNGVIARYKIRISYKP